MCLQHILISQGLLAADMATGYFGRLTQAAVKKLQAAHGLVSSGTPQTTGFGSVGPKTRALLMATITATNATPLPKTAVTPGTPAPAVTPTTTTTVVTTPTTASGGSPAVSGSNPGAGGGGGTSGGSTTLPTIPDPYPTTTHPHVYFSEQDFLNLLSQRNALEVSAALSSLEKRVQNDVNNPTTYTTPYSGTDINAYLELTYEVGSAARTAADLATYSYLVSANRGYGSPTLAQSARDLGKRILLVWAQSGFRDAQGNFRSDINTYYDSSVTDATPGTNAAKFDIGLVIGRGMPYWADAQDLLMAQNAFSNAELTTLSTFANNLFTLAETAGNYRATNSNLDCNRYSNHASITVSGLLALASLLQDPERLQNVALGTGSGIVIPWTTEMQKNIYGQGDPLLNCAPNDGTVYQQTSTVTPGEIDDRYRAQPYQGLSGYPVFSLNYLLLGAQIMQRAGLSGFGFVGDHQETLQSAADYYSYYFTRFLSDAWNVVPSDTYNPYGSYKQYVGMNVSSANGDTVKAADGIAELYLLAHRAYPTDTRIGATLYKIRTFVSDNSPAPVPFASTDPLYLPYLTDVSSAGPYTIPPTVTFDTPSNNATVAGTKTITVIANDVVGISSVQFKLDGTNLSAAEISAPYSITWDTNTVPNGMHTLTAVATDAYGLQATSTISVNVWNIPVPNNQPVGYFDALSSTGLAEGWAYDPKAPSKSISIAIYADGPQSSGKHIATIPANTLRGDVNAAMNITGAHGFNYQLPKSYVTASHTIYIYGTDLSDPSVTSLLIHSPRTFTP